MTIRVFGTRKALRQAKKEFDKKAETIMRTSALATYADLVRTTPVDTGRARQSWTVSWDFPRIVDWGQGGAQGAQTLLPRGMTADIWFANGVEYIQPLNMGHSKQAPTRFIEQAIIRNIPGQTSSIDI